MKNFSGGCQAAGADKPLRAFFIWITNIVTLSDKMHRLPWLIATSGCRFASGGFQQPGHIIGQSPHGLKPFSVQRSLSGFATIDNIPILRRYHWHIHHLERHIQCLIRCCSSASPADSNGCRGFSGNVGTVRVKGSLDDGEQGPIGLSPIYRRAHNQRVTFSKLGADAVTYIVIEDAGTGILLAGIACYAPADGFVANPYGLAFNAVLFQLFGHLR